MKNFKWVKGNTLPMAVALYEVLYQERQQPTKSEYYPPVGSVVTVNLVGEYKTITYPNEVDGNIVTFVDDGSLQVGKYGIEIKVRENARNLRSFKCGQVEIIRSSDGMELGELPVQDGAVQLDSANYYWAKGDKGDDGLTPFINQDGYWQIGETVTDVKAQGPKGDDGYQGADGITPHIDPTTNHWFLGDEDTGVDASGHISVKVNGTTYAPDANDIVNLPAYPSSLSQMSEDATHRLVSDTQIALWTNKYTKPVDGITSADLSQGVQSSLEKANTALQRADLDAFTGTENITSVGNITSGQWMGTPIQDAYISGASTWNTLLGYFSDGVLKAANMSAANIVTALGNTPVTVASSANAVAWANVSNKPTKLSDFTDDLGTTPSHSHSQYVLKINVGTNEYLPSSGVVTLPAYPTTLPASDVYPWAKAENKPTYDYSEITNTPTIPSALADLTDDSSHRLVTDTLISTWNGKQDAISDLATIRTRSDEGHTVYGVVPSAAYNTGNELADKVFVNSSIATATATYRGSYNLVSDLSLTTSASHSDIATALGTAISTADNNDYCFVEIPTDTLTPAIIASTERYKHNGTGWEYEYTLNNSGFTAVQWAAINSGLASGDKTKLDGIAIGAQVNVLEGITVNGTAVTPTNKVAALTIPVVYDWALASTKPTYSYSEITNTPNIPTETTVSGWGFTKNAGTVTSVGLSVPTGFAVSGTPVTGAGTLALAFDTGYSLPTTAKQTNWDTAYGWGDHSQAGYLTSLDMPVENLSSSTQFFVAEVGKCYYRDPAYTNYLEVSLPQVSGSKTKNIILWFSVSNSTDFAISNATGVPIRYYENYKIEANKRYEVNLLFNGYEWIVSSAEITTT